MLFERMINCNSFISELVQLLQLEFQKFKNNDLYNLQLIFHFWVSRETHQSKLLKQIEEDRIHNSKFKIRSITLLFLDVMLISI